MEKPVRSKKKIVTIEIIAVILLIASVGSIVVCGLLTDNGYGDYWWPLVGLISFFVLAFCSLGLLILIRKDAITYEVEAKEKKVDAFPLHSLLNLFPGTIESRLLASIQGCRRWILS